MRVLSVMGDVPFPPIGGARTRNAHLVRALAESHDVVAVALDWGGAPVSAPDGIELHTVPWELPPDHRALEMGDESAWERLTRPGAPPFGVGCYESAALCDAIRTVCRVAAPDVAVLTETAMAQFRTALPPSCPWVLDLHDVHAAKQRDRVDDAEADRLLAFERAAVADATTTVCVSGVEADRARQLLGATWVEVVSNGVDGDAFRPGTGPGDSDRLVFTGSLHTPENIEAVIWFTQQVLPLVREKRPTMVLDIVGSQPAAAVLAVAGDGVRVHADVPDIRPHLQEAGIVVVPLLHGGGTRLKVLEAAACGRSVVTTTVGVEGLTMRHDREVDVADDPEAFAGAILRLAQDAALRTERGRRARAAAERYDWRVIGRHWCDVVEAAAGARSECR